MSSTSSASRSERVRVYRAYRRGEASKEDVREVFGEEIDEFESFNDLMQVVAETPTNEPDADLFR
jgi:hypothetical protein